MQTIQIGFENCDSLDVVGNIVFDATNGGMDNVTIIIPKESNGVHCELGCDQWETTKFNRILKYDDITSIDIADTTYNPVWYEENEYCDSQTNKYQHTYKTENGDLVIEIFSANKQRQFDNERIVELITDYLEKHPTMTFGQVIGKLEKSYGGSIDTSINSTVIEMLEELLMEAI